MPDETAAGIIVGWTADRAYVVTACHVPLASCGAPTNTVTAVTVDFYGASELATASIFDKFDACALDLGVVTIPGREFQSLRLANGDPAPGIAVRLLGHPAAGD